MGTIKIDEFDLFTDQPAVAKQAPAARNLPQDIDVSSKATATNLDIEAAVPIILVIDDDYTVRAALKAILKKKFDVILCADGNEGVAAANCRVLAVILDIKMHGKDGFQTFKEIKERIPDLPIIFHSAYQDLKDPYEIMNDYRPFGYVQKSGSQKELLDIIHSAVKYSQQVKINIELYQTLLITNENLASARDAAEAASKAKSTFLKIMSHELRTPLNHIMGFSELLLDDAEDDGLAGDYVKYFANIKKAGEQLLSMVCNMLEMARADTGVLVADKSKIDLSSWLVDVEQQAKVMASVKHNEFTIKYDASLPMQTIYTDAKRFRVIITNILDNACKFTEQGKIILEVTQADHNNAKWLVFNICDTGIGMTPAQLATIFEPFYVVDDSATRKHNGIGMGLAIAKIYCQALGGIIEVESTPDNGTHFCFRLPLEHVTAVERSRLEQNLNQDGQTKTAS